MRSQILRTNQILFRDWEVPNQVERLVEGLWIIRVIEEVERVVFEDHERRIQSEGDQLSKWDQLSEKGW